MYRAYKTPGGNDLNETKREKQRDTKRSKRERGKKKKKKTRMVGDILERGEGEEENSARVLTKF